MNASRRSAIVPRLRMSALVVAIAIGMAGCGAGGRVAQQSVEADPATVVRVLPTRPGLNIAAPGRTLTAAGFARAALGRDDPALASSASDAGLRSAAVREWTGPGGARLVAIAGLWDDGEAATSISGQVARDVVDGGTAWTPSQYGGSQGERARDSRALSTVVGKVSLLVIAEGPVGDAEVLRTMDLMRKAAAQQDLRGAGG
jgi:hypothetical protein